MEQGPASVPQSRDVPASGGGRRVARFVGRSADRHSDGMARAISYREDRAVADRRGRSWGSPGYNGALEIAVTARRRGADPLCRPLRLRGADRLRLRRRAEAFDPRAGTVRAFRSCHDRLRARAVADLPVVAGGSAGANDPGSAWFLERQL